MAFEGCTSKSALSQVSKESLTKLCSNSCKETFALIRETNVHLQGKANDLERKLCAKTKEVAKLTDSAIETQAQIKMMLNDLGDVRQELADTKVTCEKWVESCKGYQLLLNKQNASNVRFGIGYNHTETPTDFFPKTTEDGRKIVSGETSEEKECTSFHENFLKTLKESSSKVLIKSDIKPSIVSSTSRVENLKTTDDLKPIKTVRNLPLNEKEKAKECEICGLFNHKTEFCKYRKGNQYNKKISQLVMGKQLKNDFEETFLPKKQQPGNTFSQKKMKSQ